jgi:hypothetical protein
MRAEGRPLPFAGFKPKGSGKTREVREAEAQAKRSQRFLYGESKREAEAAKTSVQTIRAMLPRYVCQDHFDVPGNTTLAAQAVRSFEDLQALPKEGPFAYELARLKIKAFAAMVPVFKAATARAFKEAIQREKREAADRQYEETWAFVTSRLGRQKAPCPPQPSGERASDSFTALEPLPDPDAYLGPDIPPARPKPVPEPEAMHVIMPDFQGRLAARLRYKRQHMRTGLNEDDGRRYAFTPSGKRYLTSRRTR